MRRATGTLVRALTGGVLLAAVTVAPVAAQEAVPTTTTALAPIPTTSVPEPTTVPEGTGAATVTVDDEASYRAALASLSTAPSGPNTVELGADIVVDDGTDPTYTGDADLVVDGNGHALDGAGANRLLVVDSADGDLSLTDLTLREGRAAGDGGALLVDGGAWVEIDGVTFSYNEAGGDGGAVTTSGDGEVSASTFEGNIAEGDGGAIRARSMRPIATSTFVGNRARRGGAVAIDADLYILDVTMTANVATQRGGALRATGNRRTNVIAIYGTLAGNVAPVAANLDVPTASLSVLATALADPAGGGTNCDPVRPVGATDSFSDDASCGTAGWAGSDGADALLGPLQDNGGPTETMEPAPQSPLVDVIDPLPYWAGPTLNCTTYDDQRGVTRPQDGNGRPETGGTSYGPYGPNEAWCDIGAVEREAPRVPPAPVPLAPRFTG